MGAEAVFVISSLGKKLLERLQRKSYRHAYLAQHVRRGVAYQIRALRDMRQWKQGLFAKLLGKPQSVVSRLEDPDYGKMTLQTLLEVANVFDVALEVRFVSYSSFVGNSRDVSVESMRVPDFKDDLGMKGLSSVAVRGGTQLIVAEAGSTIEVKAEAGILSVLPSESMHATMH